MPTFLSWHFCFIANLPTVKFQLETVSKEHFSFEKINNYSEKIWDTKKTFKLILYRTNSFDVYISNVMDLKTFD
jgi:hypothetical protein